MPSQRTLDHLVYLAAPGQLPHAIARFAAFGFVILPGGTHADGLTANALVVLPSGAYIEIIHFVQTPDEAGPPGSPERRAREGHWWAGKAPGWIDWALLGLPAQEAMRVYDEPKQGGRTREDGERLEWKTTFPKAEYPRGSLPFYCHDITPRERRAPTQTEPHPNEASLVSKLVVGAPAAAFAEHVKIYTTILGVRPERETAQQVVLYLDAPSAAQKTTLVLEAREGLQAMDIERVFVESADGTELEIA